MTVSTKGRKIGATGEICNKYKHSKILSRAEEMTSKLQSRKERRRLCPEDGKV